MEPDAERRSSGGPSTGFVKWAPALGVALLLLIGLIAYSAIAPRVRQRHKVERAVRARGFTHVSCHQPDPFDMTKYMCTATTRDQATACVGTGGTADRPEVQMVSRGTSC